MFLLDVPDVFLSTVVIKHVLIKALLTAETYDKKSKTAKRFLHIDLHPGHCSRSELLTLQYYPTKTAMWRSPSWAWML